MTNGVRSADRTLRDLPPIRGSAHLCKLRWPLCGRAVASLGLEVMPSSPASREPHGDRSKCCQFCAEQALNPGLLG